MGFLCRITTHYKHFNAFGHHSSMTEPKQRADRLLFTQVNFNIVENEEIGRMDHHDHTVTLPLRLAAEPYAKDGISSSCVSLGILAASRSGGAELAVLADDDGIHGFCSSQLLSRDELLERLQAAVPKVDISTTGWKTNALLALVRVSHQHHDTLNVNEMKWHWYEEKSDDAIAIDASQVSSYKKRSLPVHNDFVAQLLTNSIRQYYSQQILEPSVRGMMLEADPRKYETIAISNVSVAIAYVALIFI